MDVQHAFLLLGGIFGVGFGFAVLFGKNGRK